MVAVNCKFGQDAPVPQSEPPLHEPADLSRRERRKLEVHSRILQASVELFETRGVEATKVIDIAERADVAHKTFFNHFASKRDLLREIAALGLEQLLVDIETARKQPTSTRERIYHFFEKLAANADESGPMHRELLTEIVHAAHETGNEPEQARKLHDAFGAIVSDGVALGDLSDRHSPETLTEMLMGAFYVLMFNWANLADYPLRERALATARFLADSMTLCEQEPT
jgi:AcrR family transcriptional regulator